MRTSTASSRIVPVAKPAANTQYGALPYRIVDDSVEVLLITSRRTRRWVVPKGWPIRGLSPQASAAREALEEAGISGEMQGEQLGSFVYQKELRNGGSMPCTVEVFAMKVTRQRKTWLEKNARELRWFPLTEAAEAVDEPQLRKLILRFGAQIAAMTAQQH